jgi:endonuclease-3
VPPRSPAPRSPGRSPKKRVSGAGGFRKPTPEFAAQILDILEVTHPDARCALNYHNAFELVVATILSAQCTDERVNQVTPELFRQFPTPEALAAADPAKVEEIIRSTGFFRAKARSITGCARALVAEHGGVVPPRLDALIKLPGIGRKTANVVLGHAFDIAEGVAVDTHVLRVGARIGLTQGDDALEVESQLMKLLPRARWTRTTDLIIFHGRRICDARKPACGTCPVFSLCRWESRQAYATTGGGPKSAQPRPRTASRTGAGRGNRLGRRLQKATRNPR